MKSEVVGMVDSCSKKNSMDFTVLTRRILLTLTVVMSFAMLPLMYGRLFTAQLVDFGLVKIPFEALVYCAAGALFASFAKLETFFCNMSRMAQVGLLLLLLFTFAQFFYLPVFTVGALGFIVIPLLSALYFRECIKYVLPYSLSFLWLISIWRSLMDIFNDLPVAGVCGNWNWNMTIIFVTLPFFIRLIWTIFYDKKRTLFWFFTLGAISVTLMVFGWSNFSKGAFLGLIGSLFFLGLAKGKFCKNYFRMLLVFSGVVLGVLIGLGMLRILFESRVESFLAEDVRSTLWQAAIEFIKSHPQGGGVGLYESFIGPYIPAEYYYTPYAVIRNPHPHNWLLFMAAERGVFTAIIAFITVLIVCGRNLICLSNNWNWLRALVMFCFLILFFHAQVDVIDYEYPTNILLLVFFGILIGFLMPEKMYDKIRNSDIFYKALSVAALMLGILSVIVAGCGVYASWLLRKGDIAYGESDFSRSGKAYEESYNLRPSPDALYRMQNLLLGLQDFEPVVELNNEYAALGYEYFARHDLLAAIAQANLNRNDEALILLEKDIARCPESVAARIVKMNIFATLKRDGDMADLEQELNKLFAKRQLDFSDIPLIMNNFDFDVNNNKLLEHKQQLRRQRTRQN